MADYIGIFFYFAIISFIAYWVVQIPIMIAKNRGISGSELNTVVILSWTGIFIGITWLIAIILALVWQPEKWIDKAKAATDENEVDTHEISELDKLEKLNELKEKGILTQEEFDTQKKAILNKING
jgi:hypothetical protein